MNRKSLFITLPALLCFSCASTPFSSSSEETPTSESESSSEAPISSTHESIRKGYVHAKGEILYDGEDKPLLLRGTNAGGMFIQERWMCLTDAADQLSSINTLTKRFDREDAFDLFDVYQENYWQKEDFENLKALGVNCLRVPISYMDLFDCDYELLHSDEPTADEVLSMKMSNRKNQLAKLDRFFDMAEDHGLYVILDLHGAFGSQNGNDHSLDNRGRDWLWKQDDLGAAYRELTLEVWQILAERYKDNKNIAAYDLLNEPAGDSGDEEGVTSVTYKLQWDYFDTLYKEIRKIDQNHPIIMESCWAASNLPQPSAYNWENVIYEFHHYEGSGYGDDDFQAQSFDNRIRDIKGASFGIPLYMGEFCPHCSYEGWDRILKALTEADISWTTWTYKVRGFSEWGLYNVRVNNEEGESYPVSEVARINRDSYDEILRKWGPAQRAGVTKNEGLCEVVSKWAKTQWNPSN